MKPIEDIKIKMIDLNHTTDYSIQKDIEDIETNNKIILMHVDSRDRLWLIWKAGLTI